MIRRRYDAQTRTTAVRQAMRDGVATTSKALSIPRSTLRRWVAGARAAPAADFFGGVAQALSRDPVAAPMEPVAARMEPAAPEVPSAADILAQWDRTHVGSADQHLVLRCDPGTASVADGCWRDASGSGNDLRSEVGGRLLPSSDFAGEGAFRLEGGAVLVSARSLPEPPFTMVVTAKMRGPASGRIVSSATLAGAEARNWVMGWYAGGEGALFNGERFVNHGLLGGSSDACIHTLRVDADGTVTLRRNGRDLRLEPGVKCTIGPGRIGIGGMVTGGGVQETSDCAVAEVRVYDKALDPLELAAVERVTAARYGVAIASTSRWMDADWDLLADKSLRELTLPGTHDSGTYALLAALAPDAEELVSQLWTNADLGGATGVHEYITAMATAQTLSFYGQLMLGIRYLDLRVCEVGGVLRTCHSVQGKPIADLLADIKHFLEAHPREIVVIKVGFKGGDPTLPARAWPAMGAQMGALYNQVDADVDFDALRLGDLVRSGRRCLFLLDDTHVWSIYDSSATTNATLLQLLAGTTTEAQRYQTRGWYDLGDEGQTLRIGIQRTIRLTDGDRWVVRADAIGDIDATTFLAEGPRWEGGRLEIEVGPDATTEGQLTWLPVGNDFDVVCFPNPESLRYGVNSTWQTRTVAAGEAVECVHTSFGLTDDPAPNVLKSCQLLVRKGQLLEAQCFRPVSPMDYALGFLEAYGSRIVPLLFVVLPPIAPSLIAAAVSRAAPKSLLENARDSRTVLKDYVTWLGASPLRARPQVIICDHVGEVPLVDLAIRLSTGRPCDDLLATIRDIPPTWNPADLLRLDQAIATLLKAAGYGCHQAGNYLKEHIGGIGAETIGDALEAAGYGADEAGGFLRDAYGKVEDVVEKGIHYLNPLNWQ